ncbi:MAG: ABC transporter permease subunit [Treponema sp.]|jgi:putative aldouronate transport system permease protein|nr:ABC transporter permease subunit [Treponema sp.]
MKNNKGFVHEFTKNRALFFMAAPAVLFVFIFQYIPMIGLVLAFKNYRYDRGVFGSAWNGLENFRFLFSAGTGFLITRNTFLYNVLNLITSQFLAIVIAIIITEIPGTLFKRTCQSVIFLPYFISWVIVGTFVFNIFNYETGVMNNILKGLGADPVNVYDKPYVWPFIICIFNSWKWCGYNSVVYIAAITAIDIECFEAADIDGANIFQKIRHITLTSIRPTIIIIFLLHMGRVLRGDFEMFYQIVGRNGQLYNTTDVIDVFVFRSLITSGNIGMTAATTLYQSVLCFLIIMIVNHAVKKIESDYSLF